MNSGVIITRFPAQPIKQSKYPIPIHLRQYFHLLNHHATITNTCITSFANLLSPSPIISSMCGEEPNLACRISTNTNTPITRVSKSDIPEQTPPLTYRLQITRDIVRLGLKNQHAFLRPKQFVQRLEMRRVVQHAAGQGRDAAILVDPEWIAGILYNNMVTLSLIGLLFHVCGTVSDDQIDLLVFPRVAPWQMFLGDIDHLLV
mmetsp:Transcript_18402/g.27875  ORF Transcript_18402/g.27875 Transcript_18402/m.27875 type:complete len:203 (-) Transcript_18402:25-633(-)